MTARNDVTQDKIRSKKNSTKYRDNWNTIFNGMRDSDKELVRRNKHKKRK